MKPFDELFTHAIDRARQIDGPWPKYECVLKEYCRALYELVTEQLKGRAERDPAVDVIAKAMKVGELTHRNRMSDEKAIEQVFDPSDDSLGWYCAAESFLEHARKKRSGAT